MAKTTADLKQWITQADKDAERTIGLVAAPNRESSSVMAPRARLLCAEAGVDGARSPIGFLGFCAGFGGPCKRYEDCSCNAAAGSITEAQQGCAGLINDGSACLADAVAAWQAEGPWLDVPPPASVADSHRVGGTGRNTN